MPVLHSDFNTQHYHEGIDLFNAGHFWDAHERWEECWRGSSKTDAVFYKGIIQTAAALVHWQRGNLRGLERNWQKARPKLASLLPIVHNADLSKLITDMDAFVVQPQLPWPRIALYT